MTKQQTALEPKGKEVAVSTETGENLFERIREATQAIAHRAFELFEKRGRRFGNDLEDWLRAEAELTRRVPLEVTETDDNLVIRAETPGFKPEELKVFVEPNRLTISGEREEKTEKTDKDTIYSEWQSQKIFRAFDLPREVKTTDLTATLKEGVLSMTLPKAEISEPQKVTVKPA